MSSKTKLVLFILVVLVIALGVVTVAYVTSRRAVTGPEGGQTPPPQQGDIETAPKIGRFDLGEFIATSRDEELHYIKIQVEIGYIGNLEKELEERKAELRDCITNILMKLNIQRAKEDYIDRFLHKDIERELNRILGKSTSESRIVSVFIPTFLIN
ncbi:MAG: flagellar basal body-associated FliL family protein [Candidatus Riflebacteria bacterium]|nr:flagellar basal body-associated FliL family protein [Candidatus Riflebacteria bacterium]